MALRLIIEDEEGATTIVPLTDEEVTIGREAGNTIQLTEQNVSRQHARLSLGPDGWVIEDLDSYNGVKVNNVHVDASVTLMEGDLVQIGDYHLALSENVERTTLNLDRPLEAANTPAEPFQVAPSVDLPRLSEREMAELQVAAPEPAAVATPQRQTPAAVPMPSVLEDEDEEKKGGAGKWIAIVIVLLAVVGVGGYFATQGGKGGGSGTTVAKAPESKKPAKADPAKAVTPEASAGADDSASAGAADSAGEEPDDSAGEEPVDSAGEAPVDDSAGEEPVDDSAGEEPVDDSAGEEPVDDSAGEEPVDDSAGEEPVDDSGGSEPVKKKKKASKPKADPAELLQQARAASLGGNASKAYKLAKQSYKIDKNAKALQLMGVSACKMGDAKKAKSVYAKVSGGTKKAMASICAKNGVDL